ncbi:methylated-DNA--[protein]-cysteine S-methyltransferase [Angustibacter sp. McL0619]|uniref:methylated-DNA--[protein]-cysteine S-methyltransferase n=1 Tax=Angustibacter sp. McL0619 TaxID=3415676 RepID=UPI003CEE9618
MSTRHAVVGTLIGDVTVVADGDAVVGLYFPQHWTNPDRTAFGPQVDPDDDALLTRVRLQLGEYLAGERQSFDLPTAASGSAFEHRVWEMLEQIPYGETTSYGEIAESLGDRNLARMVGRAVGHNPLSVVVPCHRVVGKDGKLTGYAGGLERKHFLLDLEGLAPVGADRLF